VFVLLSGRGSLCDDEKKRLRDTEPHNVKVTPATRFRLLKVEACFLHDTPPPTHTHNFVRKQQIITVLILGIGDVQNRNYTYGFKYVIFRAKLL
jgi:hypothetical protein